MTKSEVYVLAQQPPADATWLALVPGGVEAVSAALDELFGGRRNPPRPPLEVWQGRKTYCAVASLVSASGFDISIPLDFGRELSNLVDGTVYMILDVDGYEDLCFAYEAGRGVDQPRELSEPQRVLEELGCGSEPQAAPGSPGFAATVVLTDALPSGLDTMFETKRGHVGVAAETLERGGSALTLFRRQPGEPMTIGMVMELSRRLGDARLLLFRSRGGRMRCTPVERGKLMPAVEGPEAKAVLADTGLSVEDLFG